MIDLSIVTITYNGLQDTLQMIDSLKRVVKSVSYEIIVVDNASSRDEAAEVAAAYPDVVTIRSHANLGFSGGNNLGIRQAKGRYVMLLNNDTYIEQDGLGELINIMEANANIGAVSPKIKFAAEPHLIQFAGFTTLSSVTLRNSIIGYGEQDCGQYDAPRKIPYGHGAAMMVRREAIDKAGLMPEEYFLYYEELDWSLSIRKSGYEIWYEPACTIFHRDGQTSGTGTVSPFTTFYLTRNRMLLAWRHAGKGEKWASVVYQMGVAMPKNVVTAICKGKPKTAGAVMRACLAFCSMKKGKCNNF